MLRRTRWFCLGLILAGWLSATAPALAQGKNDPPRTVNDEAGLFSKGAIRDANREIADIKNTYKKDLLIETREKGPPQDEYEGWAKEQAKRYRVEGVFIVITKEPRHFQVLVGNATRKKGLFTDENVNQVKKLLGTELRKDRDDALRSVVSYVHKAFRENAPAKVGAAPVPAPAEVPGDQHQAVSRGGFTLFGGLCTGVGGLCTGVGGLLCLGAVILGGVWLLIGVIRSFTAPRPNAGGYGGPGYGGPGYGGGGGGGGGGFFPSLLGGMFGAAAGSWMYNSWFGGGHSSSAAPPSYPAATHNPGAADYGTTSAPPEPTDVSSGYSGGGGDWGNEDKGGGGGDAGGADAGGGDFGGGGDVGGGGGDFGGGGGGDFGGGGGDFGGGGDGGGGGDW